MNHLRQRLRLIHLQFPQQILDLRKFMPSWVSEVGRKPGHVGPALKELTISVRQLALVMGAGSGV